MNHIEYNKLRKQIKKVLRQHPYLCAEGYTGGVFDDIDQLSAADLRESRDRLLSNWGVVQIDKARHFIKLFGVPQKDETDSRTLKSAIAHLGSQYGCYGYVSNGGAIVAALLCGITVVPDQHSTSCHFIGGSGRWKQFEDRRKKQLSGGVE